MRSQVLVKRYAQGWLGTLRNEAEYSGRLQELRAVAQILEEQEDLKKVLLTPFVPASRKQRIAREILDRLSLHPMNIKFLMLLLENERFDLLPEIVALLPDLWNEARGISSLEVFSVVPLAESQKSALQDRLEHIEQRPVALRFKLDPSLIGGLSLRKGNIVYDVSVKGSLERIREIIIEG
jgi:ATP synthase F1 delta subunit